MVGYHHMLWEPSHTHLFSQLPTGSGRTGTGLRDLRNCRCAHCANGAWLLFCCVACVSGVTCLRGVFAQLLSNHLSSPPPRRMSFIFRMMMLIIVFLLLTVSAQTDSTEGMCQVLPTSTEGCALDADPGPGGLLGACSCPGPLWSCDTQSGTCGDVFGVNICTGLCKLDVIGYFVFVGIPLILISICIGLCCCCCACCKRHVGNVLGNNNVVVLEQPLMEMGSNSSINASQQQQPQYNLQEYQQPGYGPPASGPQDWQQGRVKSGGGGGFCTSCGAPKDGRFCGRCGSDSNPPGYIASPPPQPLAPPPQPITTMRDE
jgi:hypothetical protein